MTKRERTNNKIDFLTVDSLPLLFKFFGIKTIEDFKDMVERRRGISAEWSDYKGVDIRSDVQRIFFNNQETPYNILLKYNVNLTMLVNSLASIKESDIEELLSRATQALNEMVTAEASVQEQ